ncbi:MAG: hypothetical protein ACTSSK_00525 [Candidatus Heimdallarchaeota archaeon]
MPYYSFSFIDYLCNQAKKEGTLNGIKKKKKDSKVRVLANVDTDEYPEAEAQVKEEPIH